MPNYSSKKGASLVEYALVLLIIITCIFALTDLGNKIPEIFCDATGGFLITAQSNQFNRSNQTWRNGCCTLERLAIESDNCKVLQAMIPDIDFNCPDPCLK